MKLILKDLGVPINDPILLYCDNMSNIYLAQNPVFHTRTKHIEVRYHFIREQVLAGDIELQHINTNMQTADIFTKALGIEKLWQFMTNLGLSTINQLCVRGRKEQLPKLTRRTFPNQRSDDRKLCLKGRVENQTQVHVCGNTL